jgi:NAD(P)-dependent dehydrogenase (short-subunit alcohol dehydrogenase family)
MPAPDEFPARLLAATALLEELCADRGPLSLLDEPLRRRFLEAAGRVSRPDRPAARQLAKAFRKAEKEERRAADEAILSSSGIRTLRRAPVFPTPPPLTEGSSLAAGAPDAAAPEPIAGGADASETAEPHAEARGEPSTGRPTAGPRLREPRACYVCKDDFTTPHPFYDQLCPDCAALNWQKRNQSADLSGRVALVTGARVKIGYHAAVKLLRAGARVVVTTRFPVDAAARFAREADYTSFQDRLEVYGLDLRHTPSVEALCKHLNESLPRLDFILNNACQTVRRPPAFYAHMMEAERKGAPALTADARHLLEGHQQLRQSQGHGHGAPLARADGALPDSAELSQLALLPGEQEAGPGLHLFPAGALDQDLQQVDLRGRNSWRLRLDEVSAVELLEVQLVNAVAPFLLNARLRGLMERTPGREKHIVNVSAMEGQFYRSFKTDKHPHTNMAKAALNMMTRTSAKDYVQAGIHMNAVDTGWITDEDPAEIAVRKVEEHGFHPPLDAVDGAARIVAPIFDGLISGEHVWGLFLKDYQPIPW